MRVEYGKYDKEISDHIPIFVLLNEIEFGPYNTRARDMVIDGKHQR